MTKRFFQGAGSSASSQRNFRGGSALPQSNTMYKKQVDPFAFDEDDSNIRPSGKEQLQPQGQATTSGRDSKAPSETLKQWDRTRVDKPRPKVKSTKERQNVNHTFILLSEGINNRKLQRRTEKKQDQPPSSPSSSISSYDHGRASNFDHDAASVSNFSLLDDVKTPLQVSTLLHTIIPSFTEAFSYQNQFQNGLPTHIPNDAEALLGAQIGFAPPQSLAITQLSAYNQSYQPANAQASSCFTSPSKMLPPSPSLRPSKSSPRCPSISSGPTRPVNRRAARPPASKMPKFPSRYVLPQLPVENQDVGADEPRLSATAIDTLTSASARLYRHHIQRMRSELHLLGLGSVSSSDDDSDHDDMDGLMSFAQNVQFCDAIGESSESDDEAASNLASAAEMRARDRDVQRWNLKAQLRRTYQLIDMCQKRIRAKRRFRIQQSLLLVEAIRQSPTNALKALLNVTDQSDRWSRTLATRRIADVGLVRQQCCGYVMDSQIQRRRCAETCLPFANFCLQHILQSSDQQLFSACRAQIECNGVIAYCRQPTVDLTADFRQLGPFCSEHREQRLAGNSGTWGDGAEVAGSAGPPKKRKWKQNLQERHQAQMQPPSALQLPGAAPAASADLQSDGQFPPNDSADVLFHLANRSAAVSNSTLPNPLLDLPGGSLSELGVAFGAGESNGLSGLASSLFVHGATSQRCLIGGPKYLAELTSTELAAAAEVNYVSVQPSNESTISGLFSSPGHAAGAYNAAPVAVGRCRDNSLIASCDDVAGFAPYPCAPSPSAAADSALAIDPLSTAAPNDFSVLPDERAAQFHKPQLDLLRAGGNVFRSDAYALFFNPPIGDAVAVNGNAVSNMYDLLPEGNGSYDADVTGGAAFLGNCPLLPGGVPGGSSLASLVSHGAALNGLGAAHSFLDAPQLALAGDSPPPAVWPAGGPTAFDALHGSILSFQHMNGMSDVAEHAQQGGLPKDWLSGAGFGGLALDNGAAARAKDASWRTQCTPEELAASVATAPHRRPPPGCQLTYSYAPSGQS